MKGKLFFIVCFALAGMAFFVPLKASITNDAGPCYSDHSLCNDSCPDPDGAEGTYHEKGTGNQNCSCSIWAQEIWDRCECYVDNEDGSICKEKGKHTEAELCSEFDATGYTQLRNEECRDPDA